MINQPKILIYAIGSLGDSLIAVAGIKAARDFFGEKSSYTLLSFKDPDLPFAFDHSFFSQLGLVDDVIYYDKKIYSSLIQKISFAISLRKMSFDAVVYLAPSERKRHQISRDKLFFSFAGIKGKMGLHAFSKQALYPRDMRGWPSKTVGEAEAHLLRLKNDGVVTSRSLENLLSLKNEVIQNVSPEPVEQWLQAHQVSPDVKLVAFCPGTKDASKKWAMKNFYELGKQIKNLKGLEVIVLGSHAEKNQAQEFIHLWAGGINACGEFDILGTARLLARCSYYIGLDSGVTHLAAAMAVPSICLSSDRDFPGRWDIHGYAPHRTLRRSVACGGCRLRSCSQKEHYCMESISVDEVFKEFKEMMKI